jgi:hypothetical protein
MVNRVLLGAIGLILLAGCAAGLQYVAEKSYPPRGTADAVQIFNQKEPAEAYERLGTITWDYSRQKFTAPTLEEIQADLKQKTYEAGGDALIVRKLELPRTSDGVLRLGADVVRFKR